jgi:hypothetical protein
MTDILAWESAGDKVNRPAVLLDEFSSKSFDIAMLPNFRPMLVQDTIAEWIDLDLADALKAGPFEPQIQTADSRE